MLTKRLIAAALSIAGIALALPASADAQVVRMKRNPDALILDAARVNAGADMVFVSGQLASPVDPTKSMRDITGVEDLGDTKTQTISALNKIKEILEIQGFTMSDVVKLTLFVAADPRTGKMDFAGVNAGFKAFFGTDENPETVARSTFQVATLVGPAFLIEIEAIAAKAP